MPQFDTSFWVQILVYAVTFAATWGSVTQRLKMLEQKVDKHNSVVERTFRLEKDLAVLDEKIEVANHRIADLEKVGA